VADDHFFPEIVDPASGAPRPAGAEGELVLTTLTKRAMPLLRYRTGDITALVTEACACGRTSARIRRLKGRADDMLIVKGVNLYPSEVEAALLAVDDLAPQYLLIVDRRTTLARLEIQVEVSAGFVERCGGFRVDAGAVTALREHVARRLGERLGLGVDLAVVAPGTLPRSEGKAVRVIERR
jgi:phenylacetate-CoA ligase